MTRRRPLTLLLMTTTAAVLATGPVAGTAVAKDSSLAGKTVVLDPGHNGGNASHPQQINRQVDVGGGQRKACNTTGTATNSGYSEAAYTWDVAKRARRVLRNRGATVILTRSSNTGVGPCVNERARIANRANADASVSIHADGSGAGNRGFHVIEPARIDGLTDDIFSASHRLAVDLRGSFRFATRQPYANYIGRNGIDRRGDLGGLRVADVPAVFIETGNMRNATDARGMTSPDYRLKVARGIANGIARFVTRRPA
ncbi:N-acetylmuramoyl-L-alanine amidase [Paraconexibacter sp. AEG42_29]|uniref:N-acetylmuramoyl-L-alanine amidase n=1 Tax=Paraconexibacter sp. AEG42_29 TaxID=2997339 RepID=A0AAU7B0M3_9ACTN